MLIQNMYVPIYNIYILKKAKSNNSVVFFYKNACYWRTYCKFKCKHHQFIWHSPMTTKYVVFATFLLSPKNSYISILTVSHNIELES